MESAILTEVSALSLSVLAPHAVCNVPPVKVEPPVIQILNDNPRALVLGCAPDVSPTKDNTFFSHVSAESIVKVCEIVLSEPTLSKISVVNVPVLLLLIQNAIVIYSALDVPFLNN